MWLEPHKETTVEDSFEKYRASILERNLTSSVTLVVFLILAMGFQILLCPNSTMLINFEFGEKTAEKIFSKPT